MFRPGQVLKVKVELSPEVVGFGRVTILESTSNRLLLQLKTSKGEKRILPQGTRLWFVGDSPDNPFNGLWSATVVSSRRSHGQTAMECTRPKFEPLLQRRKHRRVAITCPVRLLGDPYKEWKGCATRNISRSGLGIEAADDVTEELKVNYHVDLTIESPVGEVTATASVVQTRYNWLGNKTDIGLEFIKVEDEAVFTLDRLLIALGGKPRHAPEAKEGIRRASGAGALSNWLKTSKENVRFIKSQGEANAVTAELDQEEADDKDDEPEDKQADG